MIGVICVVRWPSDSLLLELDVVAELFASASSFGTEVTVMKFLVVANRAAIIYTNFNYTICLRNQKQRPNKTFFVITRTIRSGSLKLLVTNGEALENFPSPRSEKCNKMVYRSNKAELWGTTKNAHVSLSIVSVMCLDFNLVSE